MRLSQRQVVIGLQIFMFAGLLVLTPLLFALGAPVTFALTSAACMAAGALILVATWRRWRYAEPMVVALTVLISAFFPPTPGLGRENVIGMLIPPVFALILSRPLWVPLSAAATFALLEARAGGATLQSADPTLYVLLVMVVGGMTLAGLVMNGALRAADAAAAEARAAQAQAERQSQSLAEAAQRQEEQLARQQHLLDLVATLETPAVALAEGVLFAPVVGHLDSQRAQALTARLLHEVAAQRAHTVVIDIAGVATVDMAVARALLDMGQALRLLGCAVALSGISTQVATTLVDLGVEMHGIRAVRSPQEALSQQFTSQAGGAPERV
jgi:anti-anti-sigma regulatory factor